MGLERGQAHPYCDASSIYIYIYIYAGVLRCRCLLSRKTHFWSFLVFWGVLEGQEGEKEKNEKVRKKKRERERKSKHQSSIAVNADIREELINYCNHARI